MRGRVRRRPTSGEEPFHGALLKQNVLFLTLGRTLWAIIAIWHRAPTGINHESTLAHHGLDAQDHQSELYTGGRGECLPGLRLRDPRSPP
eukprot:scaffold4556_cov114-Isochrysis_galbana.AAC.3